MKSPDFEQEIQVAFNLERAEFDAQEAYREAWQKRNHQIEWLRGYGVETNDGRYLQFRSVKKEQGGYCLTCWKPNKDGSRRTRYAWHCAVDVSFKDVKRFFKLS